MEKKTTAQVAKALGIKRGSLYALLHDYPALRPLERYGKREYLLWSDEEIAALRAHLATQTRAPTIQKCPRA